jgi:hypothetical protein
MALGVACALGLSTPAYAQYLEDDRDEPKPYTDDDSQLLKGASYVLAPVGFVLEWTIARPLYYLATHSPLAPVLGANREDSFLDSPLPIAELQHSQYAVSGRVDPVEPGVEPSQAAPRIVITPPADYGDQIQPPFDEPRQPVLR